MKKPMEIRQLEAFAAVMSTGSMTGAARLLARSQPAVTRLVHELQAAVGYPLLTRCGPRVTPTPEGFLFYEEVKHLLGSWRRLQWRASEIVHGAGEPLVLATTSAVAVGLLPQALRQVERDTGPTSVRLHTGSPERVVQSVMTGAAQLGAASLPLDHRGLQLLWIGQAPCVAVLAEDDPLAAARPLALSDLAGRRIITLSNPYRLRHRIDEALPRAGAANDTVETNSSVNALALVRSGLGVALLDPLTTHGVPMQGVRSQPLDSPIPFFFGVIVPDGRPPTKRLLALSEALREAATQVPGFVEHPPSAQADLLQAARTEPAAPETLILST